ncbi:DUF4142 domain-containing protein [Deinococcus aluminii]|uniref:DUF4142 domain-containing protein n=1 Tax=Deinococcus aluminii TaxID=1656885 RepID=A0ABP9XIX4_9DEIO
MGTTNTGGNTAGNMTGSTQSGTTGNTSTGSGMGGTTGAGTSGTTGTTGNTGSTGNMGSTGGTSTSGAGTSGTATGGTSTSGTSTQTGSGNTGTGTATGGTSGSGSTASTGGTTGNMGNAGNTGSMGSTSGTPTSGTSTSGTSARLSSTDTCFIQQAAMSDMFEIQSSQVAESRASSANIKSFAKQMIQDHTKASQALKSVASKLGATVPTTLSGPKTQILTTLRGQQGNTFDRTYIDAQVMAHEQAVNLFRDYIAWSLHNGGNASLRTHATQTLPVLREHLQRAMNLQKAMAKTK